MYSANTVNSAKSASETHEAPGTCIQYHYYDNAGTAGGIGYCSRLLLA